MMAAARFRLVRFLLAALVATGAAYAFAAGGSDDDRMICKQGMETGTRFPRRICLSKGKWEQMSERAKRGYEEVRNRPAIETRR